ncbi:MAG: CBS domain-containing protein [Gammaproteobacteria bacterium]|nr:CBS domain-containing protein [Gammaproteobacteria bacterium]NNJ96427.1 CBS domain-containing protein [Gammaproteobacteria bacterium]
MEETNKVTIERILVPTKVIEPGTLVRDLFLECNRAQVQALPYKDDSGRLAGRITLKNVLRVSCLPEYMVDLAPLLGSQLSCVDNAEAKAREILRSHVEPYIQPLPKTIESSAPLIKALAVMEQNDTSYIFVVDDGEYRGVITIQAIAHRMTQL